MTVYRIKIGRTTIERELDVRPRDANGLADA